MEQGDVLVVDRNPLTREYVATFLRDQGYTLRTADTTVEALMEIVLRLPDIMLLSVQSADLRYASFLNCLHSSFAEMPVILVLDDANVTPGFAVQANIVYHLIKPLFSARTARLHSHAHSPENANSLKLPPFLLILIYGTGVRSRSAAW